MSRAARIGGLIAFVAVMAAVGPIAWAMLSIRSPLADGSLAPGPGWGAYLLVGATVLIGAAAIGLAVAAVIALIQRLAGRR